MKLLFFSLTLLFLVGCIKKTDEQIENKSNKVIYDSTKAKLYGADEYGMKTYVFAFLKKGPDRDLDSTERVELQKAHLKNISRMAKEGSLVLAGPFYGDGEIRGIYIFNVQTIEEAKKLTQTDPAIQAGSLTMELIQWYGTAALLEVNGISKTLAEKSFAVE